MLRRGFIPIAAIAIVALAAVGCASPAAEPAPSEPAVVVVPTVDYSNDAIKPHLATKVLEAGTQRVAFLLSTNKALVDAPQSRIVVTHQQGSTPAMEDVRRTTTRGHTGCAGRTARPSSFRRRANTC